MLTYNCIDKEFGIPQSMLENMASLLLFCIAFFASATIRGDCMGLKWARVNYVGWVGEDSNLATDSD